MWCSRLNWLMDLPFWISLIFFYVREIHSVVCSCEQHCEIGILCCRLKPKELLFQGVSRLSQSGVGCTWNPQILFNSCRREPDQVLRGHWDVYARILLYGARRKFWILFPTNIKVNERNPPARNSYQQRIPLCANTRLFGLISTLCFRCLAQNARSFYSRSQ